MKLKSLIVLLVAAILSLSAVRAQQPAHTFVAGDKTFLLDGKPFVLRAGELHFPRIPREYWDQRIKMCKAMGMNTICIYLFWNYHEEKPDQFDFSGQKDVAAFVKLVQQNGMYCIVRPGPYACAEWDMGGLPWWLLKKQDIQVRTKDDSYFMERAVKYLGEVGKQLAPLQIQNGGNIIMVQVENEYGVWGRDEAYMNKVKDAVRAAGFNKVQLFRCDWSSNFYNYKVDDIATGLNFGAGSNIDDQFSKFKEIYPNAPLMCSEYWSGWFDHWGRPHETRSVESFIGSMKDMMDRKISFSLYMAHGGTSFGQWGGANSPAYTCMVTSYDYNAPIDEAGNPTEKFYAVRQLLGNYLQEGETLGEIPAGYPQITFPAVTFNEVAPLFQNLPEEHKTENIQPMEMFDQGWGRILYRTSLPASKVPSTLTLTEVHDWAVIYLNGQYAGQLDRRRGENTVKLPAAPQGGRLDILVEATGRVNYGKAIIDRKGITEKVEWNVNGKSTVLHNWSVYNFPVEYAFQKKAVFKPVKADGPAWYRAEFTLAKTGDTYIDMSTWGKGMVWVNGHNIGRFWKIGPQQTLFMPGCWLKEGVNEILVLDLEKPAKAVVAGVDKPILDQIRIDESLLHRKKGQELNLKTEKALVSGRFTPEAGWKTVKTDNVVSARYICLEALSSQKGDPYTSVAELEVIGADGNALPRLKWKVLYADSEEVTASNNAADRIFDTQESTLWHTQWSGTPAAYPHQVVVDMGEVVKIKGFRYLTRSDNSANGMIKDYRFYAKTKPFILEK